MGFSISLGSMSAPMSYIEEACQTIKRLILLISHPLAERQKPEKV
jgi:hypothetical protein